jgi:hypothetical protein
MQEALSDTYMDSSEAYTDSSMDSASVYVSETTFEMVCVKVAKH